MKWFHNATIGKVLVIAFAIAVHGMFALGGYYLGLFFSSIVLRDAPWLQQPSAIFLALLIFAGAMWGFIYMEYAKEDVEAYARLTGKSMRWYLRIVQFAIAGAELSSLLYRCYQVWDNPVEATILFIFGALFLVIAFCLGKIIHAMANRPFEVSIMRARDQAGRSLTDDAAKMIGQMSAAQKLRFYQGDPGVIDEIQDEWIARDERKRHKEEERSRKTRNLEENEGKSRSFTDTFLSGGRGKQHTTDFQAAPTNQAGDRSQNGQNGHSRHN